VIFCYPIIKCVMERFYFIICLLNLFFISESQPVHLRCRNNHTRLSLLSYQYHRQAQVPCLCFNTIVQPSSMHVPLYSFYKETWLNKLPFGLVYYLFNTLAALIRNLLVLSSYPKAPQFQFLLVLPKVENL
jgi:hypothetical protein